MPEIDRKPEIYIDADACPVKDEVLRVAERHGLAVCLVSNSGMRPSRNPLVNWHAPAFAAGSCAVR